jgi:hypothetical protein
MHLALRWDVGFAYLFQHLFNILRICWNRILRGIRVILAFYDILAFVNKNSWEISVK